MRRTANGSSRRRLFGGFLAVLAGVVVSSGAPAARTCAAGKVVCQGECYDRTHFRWDELNCGGCGNSCGKGRVCKSGRCKKRGGAAGCGEDICSAALTPEGCIHDSTSWTCAPGTDMSRVPGIDPGCCDLAGGTSMSVGFGNAILSDANLSGANLTNASLYNVDLSYADLTGANWFDATVTDVVWSNTTCPDGSNSDNNGGTCCGHNVTGWGGPQAGCA